jgi:hypothetical protein
VLINLVHQNCPPSFQPYHRRPGIPNGIFHIVISIIQDTDTEKNGKIRMISRNTYFMHRKKKKNKKKKNMNK